MVLTSRRWGYQPALAQTRYPWSLWTNGEQHEAKRGVDFECYATSLIVLLRHRAKRDGLKVRVEHTDADSIRFQFFGHEAAPVIESQSVQPIGWTSVLVGVGE